MSFNNIYKDKVVLVTGHTGFKGAWLSAWLLKLGAKVVGVSSDIPTSPSLYEELSLQDKVVDYRQDIRDVEAIKKIVEKQSPDFVFHLAAQPIVSLSYSDPLQTISTNVMGTAHILEAIRFLEKKCVAVIITSDKCYDNVEWIWGYKETDHLGGKDIYSGSKGAAELIFKSYFHSFFKQHPHVKIVSARAGNVIGGGDWAKDRIVPDCMKAWNEGKFVEIRSPQATRPWQHVLEPLSGYLNLGQKLFEGQELDGQSFNFGPKPEYNHTVKTLLEDLSKYWNFKHVDEAYKITGNILFHEAGLLKLNCDKALFDLKWLPTLDYPRLIEFTSSWYYSFYKHQQSIWDLTLQQIDEYQELANQKQIGWTYCKA